MIKKHWGFVFTLLIVLVALGLSGCWEEPTSDTGVKKATANITVQDSGMTVEQENVKRRLENENMPGAVKHLYVISAMSGDVLLYSTVKGKVTSSGKRLTPYKATSRMVESGIPVNIGGTRHYTMEVLQDDGTYGSSIPYLFWFDSRDIYHQHYVSGGQILHVSDQPLSVPKVIINLETHSKQ